MKTKLFFLSALLLAMQGVCGCGGDDDDKTTFQSRWSGCKNESYDTRSGNEHAIGNMSANCICPSDVECLLSGLSKGKYAISIYRNMISDAHLQFSFSIDYDESLKGDFRK